MAEPTTHQNVTFPSNGQQAHGYLAVPPSGGGPGVLVIQEWWGLTDHIAAVCDRFAATGFVALAPDLYGGPTTHDGDEAGAMMQALPTDRAARDLAGGIDYLLAHEAVTGARVAAVGFCMGGSFVLHLAAQQGDRIAAAAAFYPVPLDVPDLTRITCPVLIHHGEDDAFTPLERVKEVAERLRDQAGVEVVLHVYPSAGHAFHNDEDLLGTYDAGHAQKAWQRTVDWLRERI